MDDTTEIVPEAALETPKVPPQLMEYAGQGRRKGVPNRVTRDVRAMVRYIAGARTGAFLKWIDRVAEDEPARACAIYIKLVQTYIPKPTGFELETVQATNSAGQSLIGQRLRTLLEAPEA